MNATVLAAVGTTSPVKRVTIKRADKGWEFDFQNIKQSDITHLVQALRIQFRRSQMRARRRRNAELRVRPASPAKESVNAT